MDTSQIGKRIRLLRQEREINQADLGKVLGVSASAISDIERGVTKLSVDDLVKIAENFGVAVSTLLMPPNAQAQVPTSAAVNGSVDAETLSAINAKLDKLLANQEKHANP